jgi:hypothetical protein
MSREINLSEHLKMLRAERPDEWQMDRLINLAECLEKKPDPLSQNQFAYMHCKKICPNELYDWLVEYNHLENPELLESEK